MSLDDLSLTPPFGSPEFYKIVLLPLETDVAGDTNWLVAKLFAHSRRRYQFSELYSVKG